MMIVRENLYNFHKTGDVKGGLNIGIKAKITAWLDEMGVENYTINDDYTIDVDGDVDLYYKNLGSFPDYIRFNIINGHFFCDNNQLTSLEGAPKEVRMGFSCQNNKLISLEGAPKEVEGSFYCSYNSLTSLKGGPKEVGGDFYCHDNSLTSLKGAPQEVVWGFHCYRNEREFSEEEVREVCNVLEDIYV